MSEYDDKIKKQLQSKFEELLQGPFENICTSALNDFIDAQVTFSERAGLSAQIIRYPIGKCCEWCEQLAGTYDAADAPPEIYARHDNCTCVVLYKSKKTGKYTDVWSKKEFESEREVRIAREKELETQSIGRSTGAKKNVSLEKGETYEEHHAKLYYEEVRNRAPYSDARQIARNVDGFSVEEIEEIRQHMFITEQPRDGRIARFDVDSDQAKAWQRLIEGKNIRESDLVLLHHEKMEKDIMAETGCTYEEAHSKTEQVYSYKKALAKEG